MNKSNRTILVVITARPSYARVKSALEAIKRHPQLNLKLVVTGSGLLDRYGDVSNVIEADGFEICRKVYSVFEGDPKLGMAKATGLSIMELATIFSDIAPDAVVTIADRYETIGTSIAASYLNIPLVHIQGGEVTGNIDEKVRHANTKFADIHFVSNFDSMNRVLRLGEDPDFVFDTGCPSLDLRPSSLSISDLMKKYGGVGAEIDARLSYQVVLLHPVTHSSDESIQMIEELSDAILKSDTQTLWFWPNIDSGSEVISKFLRRFRENKSEHKIRFFKNMDPEDFLSLLQNSNCLIGNSSAGIRECALLGLPVVNIGSRQEGRVRAQNVMDCSVKSEEILKAIEIQTKHTRYDPSGIYGDGSAGEKIAALLAQIELPHQKKIQY